MTKFFFKQKVSFSLLMIVALTVGVVSAAPIDSSTIGRPKLVVGIMVDQMRWDYIYRYYANYGSGGFKRLLREGFSNENTYIEHLPTVTAIGHTCVYTGSIPAIHGITGNDFIDEVTGKNYYCAADTQVVLLGDAKGEGRSPRNLKTSTIGDELKLATNFKSKVIGVALKDRASILPAGHMADAAYWLGKNGHWISSSYYFSGLPLWVDAFNKQEKALGYLQKGWAPIMPLSKYNQSSLDSNAYEGHAFGKNEATLPYTGEALLKEGGSSIFGTPYGNTYTLDFCREAIIQEHLGNNPTHATDFLALSLSSTDGLGHRVGTHALELEDMYVRLDHDLSNFFTFLDQQIGKGQYIVFLTADHGASHNNHFLYDHKGAIGFIPKDDSLLNPLNHMLSQKYGYDNLIVAIENDQVHFNNKMIQKGQIDKKALKADVIRFFQDIDGISFVADMENINQETIPGLIKTRLINSYNRRRSGAIAFIDEPQTKQGGLSSTGTGHGDWNPYDAHIPLLWMGWHIPHGSSNEKVAMYDIAPTVAALLHIQEPNGNVGTPIRSILNH